MDEFLRYLPIAIASIVAVIFRYFRSRNTNATALKIKKIDEGIELEKIRAWKEVEMSKTVTDSKQRKLKNVKAA